MRILHVTGIMNTGGIETWLMNIYRNMDRSKIQFDFAVHTNKKGYYDDEIKKLGGKIIDIPKFRIINLYNYRKAWREILKRKEYTIIHTHIRSTASIYLKMAKHYKIKTIAHAHSTSNGKFPLAVIKDLFQKNVADYSDIRLACSNEAGKWLFKKHQFRIIKNGIDPSLYVPNTGIRDEYRKIYNLDDTIVIGHIGRFSYPKNHDFLLDIFTELFGQNKRFRLVLVGDGELKGYLQKKIQDMHITGRVVCTGARSDIPQLLQMCDIFLFPSRYEGLGIALIEAQAAGLQCFISDRVPQEAIITDRVHRISLKETAAAWADIIITRLDIKKKNNALCIQNNGFDIKAVTKELEQLYLL